MASDQVGEVISSHARSTRVWWSRIQAMARHQDSTSKTPPGSLACGKKAATQPWLQWPLEELWEVECEEDSQGWPFGEVSGMNWKTLMILNEKLAREKTQKKIWRARFWWGNYFCGPSAFDFIFLLFLNLRTWRTVGKKGVKTLRKIKCQIHGNSNKKTLFALCDHLSWKLQT